MWIMQENLCAECANWLGYKTNKFSRYISARITRNGHHDFIIFSNLPHHLNYECSLSQLKLQLINYLANLPCIVEWRRCCIIGDGKLCTIDDATWYIPLSEQLEWVSACIHEPWPLSLDVTEPEHIGLGWEWFRTIIFIGECEWVTRR